MRGNARDAVISVQIDKRFPFCLCRAGKKAASSELMEKQREVIKKYPITKMKSKEIRTLSRFSEAIISFPKTPITQILVIMLQPLDVVAAQNKQ